MISTAHVFYKRNAFHFQGGHKPGKHGKPRKLREFEKLSKSQGKVKVI